MSVAPSTTGTGTVWYHHLDSVTGQPYKGTSSISSSVDCISLPLSSSSSSSDGDHVLVQLSVEQIREAVHSKNSTNGGVLTGIALSQLVIYNNYSAFVKKRTTPATRTTKTSDEHDENVLFLKDDEEPLVLKNGGIDGGGLVVGGGTKEDAIVVAVVDDVDNDVVVSEEPISSSSLRSDSNECCTIAAAAAAATATACSVGGGDGDGNVRGQRTTDPKRKQRWMELNKILEKAEKRPKEEAVVAPDFESSRWTIHDHDQEDHHVNQCGTTAAAEADSATSSIAKQTIHPKRKQRWMELNKIQLQNPKETMTNIHDSMDYNDNIMFSWTQARSIFNPIKYGQPRQPMEDVHLDFLAFYL